MSKLSFKTTIFALQPDPSLVNSNFKRIYVFSFIAPATCFSFAAIQTILPACSTPETWIAARPPRVKICKSLYMF